MISKTLKFVEELLPKSIFYRIHQSYIINLKNIEAYDRSTNYVKLCNNIELPVSRSKRTDFLKQL
jgi:two-component system LytT family response regulator